MALVGPEDLDLFSLFSCCLAACLLLEAAKGIQFGEMIFLRKEFFELVIGE